MDRTDLKTLCSINCTYINNQSRDSSQTVRILQLQQSRPLENHGALIVCHHRRDIPEKTTIKYRGDCQKEERRRGRQEGRSISTQPLRCSVRFAIISAFMNLMKLGHHHRAAYIFEKFKQGTLCRQSGGLVTINIQNRNPKFVFSHCKCLLMSFFLSLTWF